MKKNLTAILCALALLVSMACGVYALADDDSLVSLSYIVDIFIPDVLKQGIEDAEESLEEVYDESEEELEEVHKDLMKQATGTDGLYSADLRPQKYGSGERVTVETGAGIMMYAGAARVSHDGAFIDVTEGEEVSSGTELISGHRYLVGEDTAAEVQVLTGVASLGVQGGYTRKAGEGDIPFVDVRLDDWYFEAVDYVYNAGIFTGVSETEFQPHLTMDRAMLMTGFYRLAGSPSRELEEATAAFSDVPESAWYYKFVRWAASEEITAGIGDNKFGPTVQLTREQVATLLYSFATRYLGQTMDERTDITGYTDYDKSSEWARDALSWAVYYGVLDSSWTGADTLGGHQYADRAEVSAMLAAFAEITENIL